MTISTNSLTTRIGRRIGAFAWRLPLALGALAIGGHAPTHAAENLVIDLTYDSVMDMVRPEVHPDIRVHHSLEVTISGRNELSEDRNRSAGPFHDQNSTVQVLGGSGEGSNYASWRAAPDGRLIRTQNDPQSTRTMTVTLNRDNTCRLDVVDQLKPGFTEYEFLRVSTHTMGYFSTYRVVSTSCNIR
jgi:hypothetical protein